MFDYFGIAGLLLILVGWIIELIDVVHCRKAQVPLQFAALYGAGSLLLTLHSISLGDTVFIVLNAAATLIAIANIAFWLSRKGKAKFGKKSER
jgi:lipid-A-disaccharide synthase-like uncharacterized protein